jgi:hypothetical protein
VSEERKAQEKYEKLADLLLSAQPKIQHQSMLICFIGQRATTSTRLLVILPTARMCPLS